MKKPATYRLVEEKTIKYKKNSKELNLELVISPKYLSAYYYPVNSPEKFNNIICKYELETDKSNFSQIISEVINLEKSIISTSWENIIIKIEHPNYLLTPINIIPSNFEKKENSKDNSNTNIFNKEDFINLLKLSIEISENDELNIYKHYKIDTVSVFTVNREIIEKLNYIFFPKKLNIRHVGSEVLEHIIIKFSNNKTYKFNTYIFTQNSYLYITIFKNSLLIYHNRFEYENNEEFTYYTLITLQILNISEEENIVRLWGNIKLLDQIYQNLKNTIKYLVIEN